MSPTTKAKRMAWRAAKRSEGRCKCCNKVHDTGWALCEACNGKPHRWPTKNGPWKTVNWSLNNVQIAKILGCTAGAVRANRKKLGIPGTRRGRPPTKHST